MRIVHYAQFGPRACGLYETVKDLVVAEGQLGVDAVMVDVDPGRGERCRVGLTDGPIVTVDPEKAWDADVLVRHTSIPTRWQNIGKPIVMALHGRPESSWRLAAASDNDIFRAVANKAADARYKAFVTFWPEFMGPWRALVGDKLHYVPAPVDLDYYGGGERVPLAGRRKILIADIWRDDVTPLESLFGAAHYVHRFDPEARIHLVGLPAGQGLAALQPVLTGLGGDVIGSAAQQMRDIRRWYASCDCLVTPHTIATRVIRESLAAGLPVVAAEGCAVTPYRADPRCHEAVAEQIALALGDPEARHRARREAERSFSAAASAEAMVAVCRSVIPARATGRKLFVDVGAHLGESVRRFYRERPDAAEFDIYCFEPDPATFAQLMANVGGLPNVHCINAALGDGSGERMLHVGTVADGEGSTLLAGKLTGGVNGKRIAVRCIDAARWLHDHPAEVTIVKINAEGGEYEILPRLTASEALGRVSELYVQWHGHKFDTAERVKLDPIELQFRADARRFRTRVFGTTKGMASFAQ